MRIGAFALYLALVVAGGPVAAAKEPPADPVRGKALFAHWCAPCHGAGPGTDGAGMLPGTAALEARYKGSVPAALERRTDLNYETLHYFARRGIGAMPMFRKTELSDADLSAVAAYIAQVARAKR